jgi:malonyl CoA-acyl carrier protein transacylase
VKKLVVMFPGQGSQAVGMGCDLAAADPAMKEAYAEAWLLVSTALARYLQYHAPRVGRFFREDLEDLAAQKTMELLGQWKNASWDPAGIACDSQPVTNLLDGACAGA